MEQVKVRRLSLAAVAVFSATGLFPQEPGDFSLRAVPDVAGEEEIPQVAVGTSYTIVVRVSAAVEGVEAWSYGLCVDTAEQAIVNAEPGPDLPTILFGGPPDFEVHRIWTESGTPTGVTQAVVLDLEGGQSLGVVPPEEALGILRVELEPDPKLVGSQIRTDFCDTVGQPPVDTLVVVGAQGITPAEREGAVVEVVKDPPTLVAFEEESYNLALSSGEVEVVARVRSLIPLYGFSFGVMHTPALLGVDRVEVNQDLRDALQGREPEFVGLNLSPAAPQGKGGFTVGVVFGPLAPPPEGLEDLWFIRSTRQDPSTSVLTIRYVPGPQAQAGVETELTFSDQLGTPKVPVLFDIGSEHVPAARGTVVRITEVPAGAPFRRGDVNADGKYNISDAATVLRVLFAGVATGYDCDEALDVNDDGGLNVADAVYLLRYLFVSASAPPAPFPDCGSLSPDSPGYTGCTVYPGCSE